MPERLIRVGTDIAQVAVAPFDSTLAGLLPPYRDGHRAKPWEPTHELNATVLRVKDTIGGRGQGKRRHARGITGGPRSGIPSTVGPGRSPSVTVRRRRCPRTVRVRVRGCRRKISDLAPCCTSALGLNGFRQRSRTSYDTSSGLAPPGGGALTPPKGSAHVLNEHAIGRRSGPVHHYLRARRCTTTVRQVPRRHRSHADAVSGSFTF